METVEQHVSEDRLRDPLSEATRRNRKSLLGVSMLAITIVAADLVPTQFQQLGITFSEGKQTVLVGAFAAMVLYFLVTFAIYARSDFLAWRTEEIRARASADEQTAFQFAEALFRWRKEGSMSIADGQKLGAVAGNLTGLVGLAHEIRPAFDVSSIELLRAVENATRYTNYLSTLRFLEKNAPPPDPPADPTTLPWQVAGQALWISRVRSGWEFVLPPLLGLIALALTILRGFVGSIPALLGS